MLNSAWSRELDENTRKKLSDEQDQSMKQDNKQMMTEARTNYTILLFPSLLYILQNEWINAYHQWVEHACTTIAQKHLRTRWWQDFARRIVISISQVNAAKTEFTTLSRRVMHPLICKYQICVLYMQGAFRLGCTFIQYWIKHSLLESLHVPNIHSLVWCHE